MPIIALVIITIEFRLDMWRLTNLQRRGIPRPVWEGIGNGDHTGGWHPLLVGSISTLNV